jgi:hypothetical protein
MSPSRIAQLASLGLLVVPRSGLLAQPPADPLPAPRPVMVVPAGPPPVAFSQPNPYDIWQAYAPDRQGYFRPRVVLTPAGPFRVADGAFYPYMVIRPNDVEPTVSDSLGPVPLQPGPSVVPPRRRGRLR